MNRNTIDNILNFLKEKEGKELPKKWFDSIEKLKLVKELENHPDGVQYRYEGYLDLRGTNITKLPDNLYVYESLILKNCKQLTKLPDGIHVGETLIIIGTSIEEIPDNLNIGWNLFIGNTPLAKKYTNEEIYKIIKLRGGKIINDIIR